METYPIVCTVSLFYEFHNLQTSETHALVARHAIRKDCVISLRGVWNQKMHKKSLWYFLLGWISLKFSSFIIAHWGPIYLAPPLLYFSIYLTVTQRLREALCCIIYGYLSKRWLTTQPQLQKTPLEMALPVKKLTP